jgi:hypothetical protein
VSSASMALLAGAKIVPPIKPELPKAGTNGAVEETVVVDPDKMTGKDIDALVIEHQIEVPEGWDTMKVADKRTWLKANLTEEGAAAGGKTGADGTGDAVGTMKIEASPGVEPPADTEPSAIEPVPDQPMKTGKTKKTGTALSEAAKVVVGEIVPPNLISDIVHKIENLSAADTLKLFADLRDQTECNAFKLGGLLARIQENQWYRPKYETLRDYVEQEHGIKNRTAQYWVRIYHALVDNNINWDQVKHLGWTKLAVLASVLTEDNVKSWVETAEKQTVLQLMKTVADFEGGDQKAISDQASAVITKAFRLHADQRGTVEAALAKAKQAAETKVDTVALEFICLEFLGSKTKSSKSLAETIEDVGLDEALEAFNEAFPHANLTLELEQDEEVPVAPVGGNDDEDE